MNQNAEAAESAQWSVQLRISKWSIGRPKLADWNVNNALHAKGYVPRMPSRLNQINNKPTANLLKI